MEHTHLAADIVHALPELDRKCSDCHGSGVVTSEAWLDYWRRYGQTEAAIREPDEPEEVPCGACYGRQRIPTEEGYRLLDFIRRHALGDVIEDVRAIGATLDRAEAAANRAVARGY